MDDSSDNDRRWMRRALELAAQGTGWVEPNPQVGCVITYNGQEVGHGWHARFGGPHAEVAALEQAGSAAHGATLYATLEPCCHHGKTPPCTEAIIRAGIRRVVIAMEDPFPQVAGGGMAALAAAGIHCEVGILADGARHLIAPYLKLVSTGRPWVIAKWAMTLDGKLATASGDSQWISNEVSRARVHQLRGRMDAIVVGSGTARADNPLLTARPSDPIHLRRRATRVVVDGECTLSPSSNLMRSITAAPVLVATASTAPAANVNLLAAAGAEIFTASGDTHVRRVAALLDELGRRQMINVLVEGGGRLLGQFFDLGAVDEVHVFMAPKLAGGQTAPSPVGGQGIADMHQALGLTDMVVEELAGDLYAHGRVARQQ